MRKLITIILVLAASVAFGQTTYQLNYDSIRVGKTSGNGATSLYGKVYLKNVAARSVGDSILTVVNGRIFKVPYSGVNLWQRSGTTLSPLTAGDNILTTGNITGAIGTFSSSGSTGAFNITQSSGSGVGLTITKGGDGEGLYVNKTSGSGNAATIVGTLDATNMVTGGLSAASVSSTASDGLSGVFTNNSSSFETFRSVNNGSGLIASFRNSGGEVASIGNAGGGTFNGTVSIGAAASGSFKLQVRDALPALFVATSDATTASYGGVSFVRNTKLNGNGNGFQFSFLNSSDATAEYGYFGSIIESNTAGSENGAFIWAPSASGSRTEKMRLASSGNLTVTSLAGTGTRMVVADNTGVLSTQAIPSGGGGGTVASVSVNNSNGFAGTSSGGANPALTISTTITGIAKGNGTALSAAVAGTDYLAPSGSGASLTNVVNSITGTANQVIASASTGAVTLSLPQNIATSSSPSFTNLTLSGNITAANLGTASTYTAQASSGALTIPLRDTNGDFAAGTITATLTGNASTATALQTARNIQGVSFNGTADINPINGTGFVKASGTTLSYDNTTYAPLNSPTFTGTPSLPTGTIAVTQSPGNNSTKIATTAYVDRLGGGTITSGRYDGLITGGTNVSGTSYTVNGAHYKRIGNEVTVTGRCSLTTTSSGASVFYIDLPIASNLSAGVDLLGTGNADTNSTNIVINADTGGDRALVEFTAAGNAFMTVYYNFTYTIL